MCMGEAGDKTDGKLTRRVAEENLFFEVFHILNLHVSYIHS